MRARFATAVTAAALAVPLLAATAGASPAQPARPDHACPAATPIEHKCGPKK